MPESISYLVTETTSVRVFASSEAEALEKAELRFINPTDNIHTYKPKRLKTTIERTTP